MTLTDKAASFARTETQGETTVGDVPEMVERVARAMCEERIRSELRMTGDAERDDDIAMGVDYGWSEFASTARASLAAMREPTEAMRYAGWLNRFKFRGEPDEAAVSMALEKVRDHRQSWEDLSSHRAMIDAALGNAEVAR